MIFKCENPNLLQNPNLWINCKINSQGYNTAEYFPCKIKVQNLVMLVLRLLLVFSFYGNNVFYNINKKCKNFNNNFKCKNNVTTLNNSKMYIDLMYHNLDSAPKIFCGVSGKKLQLISFLLFVPIRKIWPQNKIL